jgi:hypothetical protein
MNQLSKLDGTTTDLSRLLQVFAAAEAPNRRKHLVDCRSQDGDNNPHTSLGNFQLWQYGYRPARRVTGQ